MSYKIVWTRRAENELASVWLNATDRDAVTAAAARLDRMLSQNPLQERHEIVNGFGTALSVPVGIDFGVDAENKLVIVIGVWFAIDNDD